MTTRFPAHARVPWATSTFTPPRASLLKRSCARGGTASSSGECQECHEKRQAMLQRRASGPEPEGVPSIVYEVLRSPGQPLDALTRGFMEPRFGHDFSQVRVHSDTRAAESAQTVNALAYTVGKDVVFGVGQYEARTSRGKKLLAHELTHVVQQTMHRTNQPAEIQRRVIDSHVSCRNTGLHGGVPGGRLSGPAVVAIIRTAVDQAVTQARRAENLLAFQRLTHGTTLYRADPAFDAALLRRFGISVTNPAHHGRIAILEREFKAVADFLKSGAPRYVCRGAGCAGDWAYALVPGSTLYLCNPFYSASLNLQASTLLHEAMHLWWNQIADQGNRPLRNAHCFEQFALDLAGATAEIPAGFAGACVV